MNFLGKKPDSTERKKEIKSKPLTHSLIHFHFNSLTPLTPLATHSFTHSLTETVKDSNRTLERSKRDIDRELR
jgi:hypothetical protein